jgi:Fe-S-cluster-containing hydrogenase component 2
MICPFGGSSWDAEKGEVLRCDLCKGDPVCAKLCPTGALRYTTITKYILLKRRESTNKLAELIRKFVLGERD